MATTSNPLSPDLFRVIDANLNRLKEGIRVIEDIARYLDNDKELASKLKALRHQSKIDDLQNLLASRDSVNDVLRPTVESEMNRSDLESIVVANYKRAQESSRVLEEMYKIVDPELSENFKSVRYALYTLEKENLLKSE
ncbi:MAG: thiamine-phosphate pyrophosphorylase [Sulfurimonadaceae bacterium]|nr:thiamine-phosphate pyrophosphorylase [Sulfurimonadaceae bacterium]